MLFAADTNGIILTTAYVFAFIGAAGGVIAYLFHQLIGSKDRLVALERERSDLLMREKDVERAELEGLKKVYYAMATDAVKSAAETANFFRLKEGKPPLPTPVCLLIPENQSPPTVKQREITAIQALGATLANIKLGMAEDFCDDGMPIEKGKKP